MKGSIAVLIIVALAVCCAASQAAEPLVGDLPGLEVPHFSFTGLAGTQTAVGRAGFSPAGSRTTIFGQGVWLKDIDAPGVEGWGGHLGVTYDLVKTEDVTVIKWDVPISWYLGAMAGAIKPETTGWQTSPGILMGFRIGNSNGLGPALVVEGWFLPGDSINNAFANINDKGRVTVGAYFPIP
jgi:hypothetical protein